MKFVVPLEGRVRARTRSDSRNPAEEPKHHPLPEFAAVASILILIPSSSPYSNSLNLAAFRYLLGFGKHSDIYWNSNGIQKAFWQLNEAYLVSDGYPEAEGIRLDIGKHSATFASPHDRHPDSPDPKVPLCRP